MSRTISSNFRPMNSFLSLFLSLSWGVEMTRQLMNASSTVLYSLALASFSSSTTTPNRYRLDLKSL